MKNWKIEIKDCYGEAIRELTSKLMSHSKIRAAIMLSRSSAGRIEPVLVTSTELLEMTRPLYFRFVCNMAQPVSRLTRLGPLPEPTLVVMRPCEIRSLVELKKINQVNDSNLIILGVDCAGTLPAIKTNDCSTNNHHLKLKDAFEKGDVIEGGREVCKRCISSAKFEGADIIAGMFGFGDRVIFLPVSERGNDIMQDLNLKEASQEEITHRKEIVQKSVKIREEAYKKWLSDFNFAKEGPGAINSYFSSCKLCRACSEICPACYCKQCSFKTEAMEIEPATTFLRATGALKIPLPYSPLLFHIGRMTHMAFACTGCGACTEACPSQIDVSSVFNFVAKSVQELFNYSPGSNLEQKPPLTVFKEDELEEVVH